MDRDAFTLENWKSTFTLPNMRTIFLSPNANDPMQVRNIGVSNFAVDHLKKLIAATGIKPAVNQVELHPLLHQDDLLEYCKREGIHVTAYFPIGGQGEPADFQKFGLTVLWR